MAMADGIPRTRTYKKISDTRLCPAKKKTKQIWVPIFVFIHILDSTQHVFDRRKRKQNVKPSEEKRCGRFCGKHCVTSRR